MVYFQALPLLSKVKSAVESPTDINYYQIHRNEELGGLKYTIDFCENALLFDHLTDAPLLAYKNLINVIKCRPVGARRAIGWSGNDSPNGNRWCRF